ncbi:IMPACT family protein [Dethiosulfovibrio salsuginis]|uniref:Xaa-Pro dipeptidase n=1 Tax=Dethiosulfovibrio salsuginis TaxID=561720 RepID=A0A1X7JFQ1_9BACT|nr:YigZ family protein [Dethiosulfovibrio salsuginis]SMG26574.1 Xaa-Pro dipeptidase [Dethiosulfovibrio salsuginis]
MTDTYWTITTTETFALKERRSQFIATVVPASTVEEAKSSIEAISKKYSDARHNCWAYRVGYPDTVDHSSDDGEPSGSAGRPILGAILKADLFDLALVVTRYFGGVKLGVRGLIDAYSISAGEALALCQREERMVTIPFEFSCTYDRYRDCLHHVKSLGIEDSWLNPSFDQAVSVTMKVPLSQGQEMETLLEDLRQRSILTNWTKD